MFGLGVVGGVASDYAGMKVSVQIIPPESGLYQIRCLGEDNVKILSSGGTLLCEKTSYRYCYHNFTLTEGIPFKFYVELFEETGVS